MISLISVQCQYRERAMAGLVMSQSSPGRDQWKGETCVREADSDAATDIKLD